MPIANAFMYAMQHLRDMLPGYLLTISPIKGFLDPKRDSLSLPEAFPPHFNEFLWKQTEMTGKNPGNYTFVWIKAPNVVLARFVAEKRRGKIYRGQQGQLIIP